ncbi:N-acyl-D-amino-acid deacylase [Candidatus Hakubella thermalkaliphila]|uniref:N-acyl-D-amino-acid deacylase n=1 Tax=Candidatus Hakubella thermalkaliphila TaxID=2754717 RepID=A0A6V8PMF7_9ACTN|nr:N-acyl-D-amino-acid deacylase [Candidatus Hakubella thermalkaliphila]
MGELLIKDVNIIDGTGQKSFEGYIEVENGMIKAVIPKGEMLPESKEVLDGKGLTASPGFIDMHSHFDWALPLDDHETFLYPLAEQGVTTVIGGNCGFSPAPIADGNIELVGKVAEFFVDRPLDFRWRSFDEFLDHLESGNGMLFNLAQIVGHGTLRLSVMGENRRYPDPTVLKQMLRMVEESYDAGAGGLSFGLGYDPGLFAIDEELICFAKTAAAEGIPLTVHIKALGRVSGAYPLKPFSEPHNIRAVKEILNIARKTQVKLQISHLIFVGTRTYAMADRVVKVIEKAAENGMDVMWDIYPYNCSNTYINIVLPAWFLEDFDRNMLSNFAKNRLRLEIFLIRKLLGFDFADIQIMNAAFTGGKELNGLNLREAARELGLSSFETMFGIIKKSKGKALALFHRFSGDEGHQEILEALIAHPLSLYETDAVMRREGFKNPSSVGAFPKILGKYVRERGLLTLEDAINRMTLRVAERFGIKDRGVLRRGKSADIVLFNRETIQDNTTIKDTGKKPDGIEYVFNNGVMIVKNGNYVVGKKPGRVIRREKR